MTQPVDAEAPPRLPFLVVGIGASAGGLEALTEFLSPVKADQSIAYIFVQHLPPTGESMLAEILSKRTRLTVLNIEDGMAIESGHLYTIKPGQVLTLKDGKLRLGERLTRPMNNRPIDDFFKSLAEEQRERAIAVVLAGMGSNGSAGAQAIKAVGGLCIAQDPESTPYPSMPRHLIDTGYADFILHPSDMAAVIVDYAGHPYSRGEREEKGAVPKRDQQHLREILAVLRTRTHQDFNGYKKPTVLRRIQRRMGLNRLTKLGDYAKLLRQTPAEVQALADDLLIHVTGFFRDPAAWEALREQIIVPLVASRSNDETIRCWVTACSSGEEAYSLAMLIVEEAERTSKLLDIKVFATDMAERTLQNARGGLYAGGIESEISPERLERFFQREDAMYRVRPELRERVIFAPQNVLQDPPFSRLDIVCCRNLLIYLEPEMQLRVLALLHFGLREGGTLFLGTSETVNTDELFEPIDKHTKIFRRIGPTRHGSTDFPMPRSMKRSPMAIEPNFGGGRSPALRLTTAQMINRALVEYHTPPAVTIDRDYRITYFHGNVEPFISLPRGEPTRELLEVARESLRGAIRRAIQQARTSDQPATVLDGWIEVQPGRKVRIAVTVSALDRRNAPDHLVVSFHERGEQRPADEVDENAAKPEGNDELQRAREELQSTIEELQTSNEELKASHEEVVSTNEELQSTNEELETSREEMQSLNEELNTVNSQLRAKMEEHQAASNDLSSLLASTDIAVLFLDPRLRIRRFTPPMRDLLDMINTDVGRPLADLARKFTDPDLEPHARQVLERLVPIEREVLGTNGRHYLRRVLPYRTVDNRIDGVVITFVDISERRKIEQELEAARERAEKSLNRFQEMMNTTVVGVMIFSADGLLLEANRAFFEMTGYTPEEVSQKKLTWRTMTPPEYIRISEEQLAELPRREKIGPYEKQYLLRDGSRKWMVFNGAALSDGTIIEFCINIGDRKRAEEALLESEERFRLLVEGARDFAMVMMDPQGIVTTWSESATALLGYTETEMVGKNIGLIFTAEDRETGALRAEFEQAAAAGRAMDRRWHVRKDGSRFWGNGVTAALRNPDGSIRSFVKVLRDETVRRLAEESLQAAKLAAESTNRMKDEFLATVSHELRTPLGAILLWAKLLQAGQINTAEQVKEGLTGIISAAEAQKELIEDLLDISRITSGKLRLRMREISAGSIVREATEAIAPTAMAKEIRLDTRIPAEAGIVRADPERLRQIVWNLLTNAVKFTHNGGQVSVEMSVGMGDVQISVIDNGRGISQSLLPHVFDRFRQGDPGGPTRLQSGLGLGLSIVKELVELHGGRIDATSAGEGKGATFTVRLPLYHDGQKGLSGKADGDSLGRLRDIQLSKLRVLLVEDDPTTRAALAALLRAQGAEVIEADRTPAALNAFTQSRFNAIISDIGLPGEDGYTLIRRVRDHERAVNQRPVVAIALTAFARETDQQMAIQAGFNSFLGKPVEPVILLERLVDAVGGNGDGTGDGQPHIA